MPLWPLTLIHVCGATLGLLSGYLAMVLRKGSGLHGAAGTVFFVSMISATSAGAYLAVFGLKPNSGNVMGSTLTFYLVATAWVTAKRRDGKPGLFDVGALLIALAIATAGARWGFEAANSQSGSKDGYASPFYFVFGSIALLFAASDVRMIVRGGVFGAKRIARHLWRMSFALLFATLSFYPGQGRLFPKWVRDTNLLYVPAVLLVGSMLLWLYRVSVRKRVPQVPLSRSIQLKEKSMQVSTLMRILFIVLLSPAAIGLAQENPLIKHNKGVYGGVKKILLRSAENMPEENYNFRPADAVRSFGQIVGHVAESQYAFCSTVLGEKNPAPEIEKSKTSKADLLAALKDAFAYCDKAYGTITDASAVEKVKSMGGDSPKLGVLYVNEIHTIEHYGNLVTYMRMKGLVPPTSDPEFMKSLMTK
jgi:uncharacterized damage-inducible protein DinB